MKQIVTICALFVAFCATASAQTKTITTYTLADGRRVVVEEWSTQAPQGVAANAMKSQPAAPLRLPSKAAGCPTCGAGCDCAACGCRADSWLASCAAAPKGERIVATGPPVPPVVLPMYGQQPYTIPAPVYYGPPYPAPMTGSYWQPMPTTVPAPLVGAGVQLRGPFGGGFRADVCGPGGR